MVGLGLRGLGFLKMVFAEVRVRLDLLRLVSLGLGKG